MTAQDQLRFAVRFAQLDLDRLRPGDWLNLRDELADFLHGTRPTLAGGIVTMVTESPFPQKYPDENFRELQKEVRGLLAGLVGTRERGGEIPQMPIRAEFALLPTDDLGVPGRCVLQVMSSVRDVFLLTLMHLITQGNTSPVRRCPECQTFFYRIRRQRYCSRRCVNRANKRAWRAADPRGKQKASAKARRKKGGRP